MERVRAVYAAWARGEFATSLPLFDANIALVIDSGIPDGGSYAGLDGVREYMLLFLEPWETIRIAGESFEEVGDSILVAVRQTGIGRGSGVPVDQRYFQLWTFRDDRVIRLEVIFNRQEALEAAAAAAERT